MNDSNDLNNWLITWIAAMMITLALLWRSREKLSTVGLPAMYMVGLTFNHWLGAFIYSLPWYSSDKSRLVISGFIQSTQGMIAFCVGVAFIAPYLAKTFRFSWLNCRPKTADLRLPRLYIIIGLLFYAVLEPFLKSIPSFSTFISSGRWLFIAGLCLASWHAWNQHQRAMTFLCIAVAALSPLYTMFSQGFAGFGATMVITLLIFIASFYRPRWRVIIMIVLMFYLGLTFFVNWMRERDEIRVAAWGGAGGSTRIEKIMNIVQRFEWLDLHDPQHLTLINGRLNQNYLVGKAQDYLAAGRVDFARGATIERAFMAVIPRIVWPGKPMVAGSEGMVSQYTGIEFARGTSIGLGQTLEFYINFGSAGVWAGFLVLGTIIRLIDMAAARRLLQNDWPRFILWFLPGIGLLETGGSLPECVMNAASAIIFVVVLNNFIIPVKH